MEDRSCAIGSLRGDRNKSFYGVFDGHGGARASQYCIENVCDNMMDDPAFPVDIPTAMKNSFCKTDKAYCALQNADDGTTALSMVAEGDTLHVANAGDCRALVVRKSGEAIPLSSDHKPNRPDERKRIADLGGRVVLWGVWRVEGVLAVSRAIGDRALKAFVTPEPELREWTVSQNDLFVVLASDGIWDVMSNDDVAACVKVSSCVCVMCVDGCVWL